MIGELTRRETLHLLSALLGGPPEDGALPGESAGTLKRLATTANGAEITGLFVTDRGELFFNVQHPSPFNDRPYDLGVVGAVEGIDVRTIDEGYRSVPLPEGDQKERPQVAAGRYRALAQGGNETGDGDELGIPEDSDGTNLRLGYMPDFNGFVEDPDRPERGYLFTNWESRPGMVSRLTLDRTSGEKPGWRVRKRENVDFRDVHGTWRNCFGTVSPWNTPLSSEEYEPDAQSWAEDFFAIGRFAMDQYLDGEPNPYRYGYVVEIEEPTSESPSPTKHFAMGRFSHENAVVMPDRKTAYMSDDGTGTVFFKFEADEPGDLSAGTLYAARANQDDGSDPGTVGFEIQWVELAHGSDDQIAEWIAEYDEGGGRYEEYISDREVRRWAAGEADDDRAAFLESREAASAKGATAEFRKMEGVNVRPDAKPGDYLYMSMSEVNETMADGEGDVRLAKNDYGVVYQMELDENYDVHRMEPAIVGGPGGNVCGGCPYDADPEKDSEPCVDCAYNPENDEEGSVTTFGSGPDISKTVTNPDNLVVLRDGRLIVGEDTDSHDNAMIWLFDPEE